MTYNSISNTPDSWEMAYNYRLDGNLDNTVYKTIDTTDYEYTGDRMDSMGESDLIWDLNGNLTAGLNSLNIVWNWDNRLRSAGYSGGDSIACKYSPDGSRLYRQQTVGENTTARKYLVDSNGEIPVILCELDEDDDLVAAYFYAVDQVLCQYRYNESFYDRYFYLHDRLGSVRNVIHYDTGTIYMDHSYTYNPYGETLIHNQGVDAPENMFQFAGYVWDPIPQQYYCYQRWYDPRLSRFTGKDPVKGDFAEPLTLHTHLYCLNDPINYVDPTGETLANLINGLTYAIEVYATGITVTIAGMDLKNETIFNLGLSIYNMTGAAFVLGYAMGGDSLLCFTEDTIIVTPDGDRPIKQIQVGDYVWAFNFETNKPEKCKVSKVFRRQTNEIIKITIGDEVIRATREHPFYVIDKGWTEAANLASGSELFSFNEDPIKVDKVEIVSQNVDVYNIEVSDLHNYYVSRNKLLAHNICRKQAIKRLEGLDPKVQKHLDYIAKDPAARAVGHWKHEIRTWLGEMEELAESVGEKTKKIWMEKISQFRNMLGD